MMIRASREKVNLGRKKVNGTKEIIVLIKNTMRSGRVILCKPTP
jgi:hypothetical protein